jgi:glycosyltransferase involved in cell wall biosynthesis
MPKMPLYSGERRSIRQGVAFGLACWKLVGEKFDVADVDHMPYFPLFSMRVVCALRRRPMVATWHEVWGYAYWRRYLGGFGLLAATLERLTVMLPNQIVAVSPMTATRLHTVLHAKRPVTLVENGIDVAAIERLEPSAERSDIVFVGRLLKHKGVDELLRAVAILKRERPNVKCVIISDGPERTNLEALASELNISKNVKFTGFIKHDRDKLALVKASKVFALPSVREGFSIVVLEGLACGLPIVTTDHPENAARRLVTPESGKLVPPANPAALAAAIAELLEPAAGRNPQAAARQYDWGRNVQRLSKVYSG